MARPGPARELFSRTPLSCWKNGWVLKNRAGPVWLPCTIQNAGHTRRGKLMCPSSSQNCPGLEGVPHPQAQQMLKPRAQQPGKKNPGTPGGTARPPKPKQKKQMASAGIGFLQDLGFDRAWDSHLGAVCCGSPMDSWPSQGQLDLRGTLTTKPVRFLAHLGNHFCASKGKPRPGDPPKNMLLREIL